MEVDPTEYEIAELGPKIKDIDDPDELAEMLAAEEAGEDRPPVKTLIQSRIDKLSEDDEEAGGDIDLDEMGLADLANAIKSMDDTERLRSLLEEEREGKNRDTIVRQFENRLESLEGGDDDGEVAERESPEERHPDLDHPTEDKQYVHALENGEYRDMWVYCETQAGELIDVSREMLGKARELMDAYNDDYDESERVVAVLIGDDVEKHTEECVALGADVVVYQEDERLSRFQHKPFTEIFCDMARAADHRFGREKEAEEWRDYDEPRYVLFPATNNGRDLSAQVQAELDSGLASDCSGLYIEDTVISNPVKTGEPGTKKTFERVLHMKRPDFSGFEYSTILCLDNPHREFHPQGGSVIPGSFEVPDPDSERTGEIVEHDLPLDDGWFRVSVTEFEQLDSGVDLSGNDVVVCVGRGISADPTKGVELALELANAFESSDVGVTRGIVTGSFQFDGHVEQYTHEERQIGETGQVIQPQLYIAAGVSGAVQHKVGCDESETIVAINTDTDARIKDWSDYFVEGDLFEVLPRLTEAVKTGKLDVGAVADGGRRIDGGTAAGTADETGGADDE
ncbi:electron transfer flavoprotein subunit alpha [Salinigranum rubrum]|uniref:Electron transfer flavoprotein subunit alpha n=1 Tax=Salinigranum rubrum TaxID=755307 RepID=A0A2I8VK75_9EURY|nr:electron transfer flavoprotein subunit alpha/FixB family protein [Salinigranum rubrum]AUV82327.1 electron transfer flavoprotein subunit alpha [Salinigranum rubrum]